MLIELTKCRAFLIQIIALSMAAGNDTPEDQVLRGNTTLLV